MAEVSLYSDKHASSLLQRIGKEAHMRCHLADLLHFSGPTVVRKTEGSSCRASLAR